MPIQDKFNGFLVCVYCKVTVTHILYGWGWCAILHFDHTREGVDSKKSKWRFCPLWQADWSSGEVSSSHVPLCKLHETEVQFKAAAPPPLLRLVCGECLIPALMYKHTTHNTSSAHWCHSVIPGLRLTSPPNLIAVIMAWRWNKSFFGGCARHDCFAVAGYKGPPHKRSFPGTSCHSCLGCGFKRFHRKSGICHGNQSNWCLDKYEAWFKGYLKVTLLKCLSSQTPYIFQSENDQDSVSCINSLIFQFIFFILLQTVASFTSKWQNTMIVWSQLSTETGNILLFLPSNKLVTHSNAWGNSFNVILPC